MTFQSRLASLITEMGTDYKTIRTFLTGSSIGTFTRLETTAQDVTGAINELKAGSSGAPASASETVAGVGEIATLAEMADGTSHTNKFATPAGVRQEREALRDEILGGVGPMADTLAELYALAQDAEETAAINDLVTLVSGKANEDDVVLDAEFGDPETDLVALYTAAKA